MASCCNTPACWWRALASDWSVPAARSVVDRLPEERSENPAAQTPDKHTRHLIKITEKPQNIKRRAKCSTLIPDTEALWDTAPSCSESDWPFWPESPPAIGSESAELPSCTGSWGVEQA